MPNPTPTNPTKPVTPADVKQAPSFSFDKEALTKRLESIVEYQTGFSGKLNHNPFFWIAKRVTPLQARLAKGETTKELHDAIMAVPEKEPPVVGKL